MAEHSDVRRFDIPRVDRVLEGTGAAPEATAVIADALAAGGVEDAVEDPTAADLLDTLLDRLRVPRHLREYGIDEDGLERIAAAAMTETRAVAGSPRPVSEQDVHDLLVAAL